MSSVMLWLPYGFPFGVRQGMMDCDFIARYFYPLLAKGSVYAARKGALGLMKNRVLPEPEPPTTSTFLFVKSNRALILA